MKRKPCPTGPRQFASKLPGSLLASRWSGRQGLRLQTGACVLADNLRCGSDRRRYPLHAIRRQSKKPAPVSVHGPQHRLPGLQGLVFSFDNEE